jgi:hypothetical protein
MTPDSRKLTWGEALERLGIWALAAIAIWFGTTVRDLTKEVQSLRLEITQIVANGNADSKRIDKVEQDVKDLYGLSQWTIETFHSQKLPKKYTK